MPAIIEFGGLDLFVEMRMQHVHLLPQNARNELDNHTRQLIGLTLNTIQNEKQFYDPTLGLDKDRRMRLIRSGEVNPSILEELKIEHDLDLVDRELDVLGDEVEGLRYIMDSKKYTVEQARMYDKTEYQMKVAGLKKEVLHRKLEKLFRFHKSSYVEVLPSTFCLTAEEGKYISVEGVLLFLTLPLDLPDCRLLVTLNREINDAHDKIRNCPMTDAVMASRRRDLLLRLGWLHIKRRTILSKICCGNNDFKCTLADRFLDRIASYRKIQEEIQEDSNLKNSIINDHVLDRITELESHLKVLRNVKRHPSGVWEGITNRMGIPLVEPVLHLASPINTQCSIPVVSAASYPPPRNTNTNTNVSIPVVIGGQERRANSTEAKAVKPVSVKTLVELDEKKKEAGKFKVIPSFTPSNIPGGRGKFRPKEPSTKVPGKPNLKQVKLVDDLTKTGMSKKIHGLDTYKIQPHSNLSTMRKTKIDIPSVQQKPYHREGIDQTETSRKDVTRSYDMPQPVQSETIFQVSKQPAKQTDKEIPDHHKQPVTFVRTNTDSSSKESAMTENQSQLSVIYNQKMNVEKASLQQTPQTSKAELRNLTEPTPKLQMAGTYENIQITVKNDIVHVLEKEAKEQSQSPTPNILQKSKVSAPKLLPDSLGSPPKTKSEISDFLKQMRQDSDTNTTPAGRSRHKTGKTPEQVQPLKMFKPTFQKVLPDKSTENRTSSIMNVIGKNGNAGAAKPKEVTKHITSKDKHDSRLEPKPEVKISNKVTVETAATKPKEVNPMTEQKIYADQKIHRPRPHSTTSKKSHHREKDRDAGGKQSTEDKLSPSHPIQKQMKTREVGAKGSFAGASTNMVEQRKQASYKSSEVGKSGKSSKTMLDGKSEISHRTEVDSQLKSSHVKGQFHADKKSNGPGKTLFSPRPYQHTSPSVAPGPTKRPTPYMDRPRDVSPCKAVANNKDRPNVTSTVSESSHRLDKRIESKMTTPPATGKKVSILITNQTSVVGSNSGSKEHDRHNSPSTTQQERKLQFGDGLGSFKIPRRNSKDDPDVPIARRSSLDMNTPPQVPDHGKGSKPNLAVGDNKKQIIPSETFPSTSQFSYVTEDKKHAEIPATIETAMKRMDGQKAKKSVSPNRNSNIIKETESPAAKGKANKMDSVARDIQTNIPVSRAKAAFSEKAGTTSNMSWTNIGNKGKPLGVTRDNSVDVIPSRGVSPSKKSRYSHATEPFMTKGAKSTMGKIRSEIPTNLPEAKPVYSDEGPIKVEHRSRNSVSPSKRGNASQTGESSTTKFESVERDWKIDLPHAGGKIANSNSAHSSGGGLQNKTDKLHEDFGEAARASQLFKARGPRGYYRPYKRFSKGRNDWIPNKVVENPKSEQKEDIEGGRQFHKSEDNICNKKSWNKMGNVPSSKTPVTPQNSSDFGIAREVSKSFKPGKPNSFKWGFKRGFNKFPYGRGSGNRMIQNRQSYPASQGGNSQVTGKRLLPTEVQKQSTQNQNQMLENDGQSAEKMRKFGDQDTGNKEKESKDQKKSMNKTQAGNSEVGHNQQKPPLGGKKMFVKGTTCKGGSAEQNRLRDNLTKFAKFAKCLESPKVESSDMKTKEDRDQANTAKSTITRKETEGTEKEPPEKHIVEEKKASAKDSIACGKLRPQFRSRGRGRGRARFNQNQSVRGRGGFGRGRPDTFRESKLTLDSQDKDYRQYPEQRSYDFDSRRSLSPQKRKHMEMDRADGPAWKRPAFAGRPQNPHGDQYDDGVQSISPDRRHNQGSRRSISPQREQFADSQQDFTHNQRRGKFSDDPGWDGPQRGWPDEDQSNRAWERQERHGNMAISDQDDRYVRRNNDFSPPEGNWRASSGSPEKPGVPQSEGDYHYSHPRRSEEEDLVATVIHQISQLTNVQPREDEAPMNYRRGGRGRGRGYDYLLDTPIDNKYDEDYRPQYQRPGRGRGNGQALLETPNSNQYDEEPSQTHYRRRGRGRGKDALLETPNDKYSTDEPQGNYQRPGRGRGEGHSWHSGQRGRGRGRGSRPYRRGWSRGRGYRGGRQ